MSSLIKKKHLFEIEIECVLNEYKYYYLFIYLFIF